MSAIGSDAEADHVDHRDRPTHWRDHIALRGPFAHVFWLWLLFIGTSTLSRSVLVAISLRDGLIGWSHVPMIYLTGLLFDAVTGVYVCLPFALWVWLVPAKAYASRIGRALVTGGFLFAAIAFFYLIAAEYFFFDEFNARFNYTAVEYLIYPTEVLGNIRDSYPVYSVLSACVITSVVAVHALKDSITSRFLPVMPLARRTMVMVFVICIALVSAKALSLDTVSRLSSNRIAGELAANGVYSFFSAVRNARIDYPRYYATLPTADATRRVRRLLQQSNTHYLSDAEGPGNPLSRSVDNSDLGAPRKLHVIFLFEESMGAEFVGSLGGRKLTPNIDRIAAEGLSFTHMYASGTRTVRGMEALATSLAPVPPESVVKRRDNEGLFNLATVMTGQGYSPTFIYGGYGTFDNMNAFFGSNGWRVIDRTDMPAPAFANVWGISDEELFGNALHEFDAQVARGERVFSLVMTTSNHKPYLFPDGIPGVAASGGGREAGVRYADYAIGRFFDQLRQRPWYRDTVLVIAGDHGARVYGRAQIPVSNYAIPFVVHSPSNVAPGTVDVLSSQVDIGPTVLGQLRLSYESRLPGRDILRMQPADGYALFNHNRTVAMMRDDHLASLGFGKVVHTEKFDSASGGLTPTAPDIELERDAEALFQLAHALVTDGRQKGTP